MARPDLIDLTGKRFGRWTVIDYVGVDYSPAGVPTPMWWCQCDCGFTAEVKGQGLRQGNTKGCSTCFRKRVTITDRRCRWCGTATKPGKSARECAPCSKAAQRNGRMKDRRPIRYTVGSNHLKKVLHGEGD